MTLQVLPSLVINALSLAYSASQFVTVKWCVPTHDEIDELRVPVSTLDDRSGSDLHHPLLQSDVDGSGDNDRGSGVGVSDSVALARVV